MSADSAREEETTAYFLRRGKQKMNVVFPIPVFQESTLATGLYRALIKKVFSISPGKNILFLYVEKY